MRNISDNFLYGQRSIRMVIINGVPKFSATDICNILGYAKANKTVGHFCGSSPEYIRLHTAGGPQNVRMIEIDNIRDILARSRSKHVPHFQEWFENTVVPALTQKRSLLSRIRMLFSLGMN